MRYCIFILLILISSISYADPAPLSKQLSLGTVGYFADFWYLNGETSFSGYNCSSGDCDSLRHWFANRMSWVIFDFSTGEPYETRLDTMIQGMQAINPNFKAIGYDLVHRPASDSIKVDDWAVALGYSTSNALIYSTVQEKANAGYGITSTTPADQAMVFGGTSANRLAFDPREPFVGRFLAEVWMEEIDRWGSANGIMPDNGCPIGGTGGLSWVEPQFWPFQGGDAEHWPDGFDATNYANSWTGTHSQIRDSTRELWMKPGGVWEEIGDWSADSNFIVIPNWASFGSPYSSLTSWDSEVRRVTVALRGGLFGELESYYAPGGYRTSGESQVYQAYAETSCNNISEACADIADSGVVSMYIWAVIGGAVDSAADGMTLARSRMNGLGLMHDCLYPTTAFEGRHTQYHFGVANEADGQGESNTFTHNRVHGSINISDTLIAWDDAYGKFFGVPFSDHNDTVTGTDPQSQAYAAHKLYFKDSTGSDTVFVSVGRYTRGSNRNKSQTEVSITVDVLGSGTWYELESGGTWAAAKVGDTVKVANAEWRFFSNDTILANTATAAEAAAAPTRLRGFKP